MTCAAATFPKPFAEWQEEARAGMPAEKLAEESQPVPEERTERDDLLGLLEELRRQRLPIWPERDFEDLRRCVARKAQQDASALSDDVFAIILSTATTLLARCQLYIDRRLQEADQCGSSPVVVIPHDLLKDGWLDRLERISKFAAEMAALRARVRHLNRLEDKHDELESTRRRPRLAEPLEDDRAAVASG